MPEWNSRTFQVFQDPYEPCVKGTSSYKDDLSLFIKFVCFQKLIIMQNQLTWVNPRVPWDNLNSKPSLWSTLITAASSTTSPTDQWPKPAASLEMTFSWRLSPTVLVFTFTYNRRHLTYKINRENSCKYIQVHVDSHNSRVFNLSGPN